MAFDAGSVTATLELDRSPFIRSLAEARRAAARFAGRTFEATLGVDDDTRVPLERAEQRARSLDGKEVEINVDVDRRGLAAIKDLGSGVKELATGLRSIGTLVSVARIPFLIAGLGAIPALASAAAVAIGQLALGLSQGLAGAAVVGGVALGGLIAGLKGYTSIITSTAKASREAWLLLHENAEEALAMRRAQILNTAASSVFNKELNRSSIFLAKVAAEIGEEILPSLAVWMRLGRRLFPEFQPSLLRLASGVTDVADSFVMAVSQGERFEDLTRILGFLASSGIRAAIIAKNLGLALLAAIQPVLSPAAGLQRTFVDLSRATRQWAESAQGQQQITRFIGDAWARAVQLYTIVVNLSQGFRNLFSIVAPGTSNMMSSLVRLSQRFSQVGAAGTESRQRIQQFVNQSKPILKALGNFVAVLTREFFKLAGGVAKMRDGKDDVNTLANAINGLAKAIPPVRRLLQQTFKDLAPTIGPLARQVARLFQQFAGSTDVLTRTVRIMTDLIRQFNKLPAPVKDAIAELVAFRIVAKILGFSILIKLAASLGRAGIALLGFSRKAGVAQGANAALRGSFLRLAATIAARFGPGAAVLIFSHFVSRAIASSQTLERGIEGVADRLRNTGAYGLIQFFRNLPGAIKDAVAQGARNIPIFGAVIQQALKDGEYINEQWGNTGEQGGKNVREGFKKGVNSGPSGIKEFAEKTTRESKNHFGIHSPSTVFAAIGRDLLAGLVVGLKKFGPVKAALEALGANMPDWVKKVLRMSSPSKVMEGIGRDVGEGFARGIEGSRKRVEDAAKKMAGGAFGEMDAGWQSVLRKIQSGRSFDIGGDLDREDTPRAVWKALQSRGWFVRGNSIFHPDTPKNALELQREEARMRQRKSIEAARAASSPGGKQITAAEMRAIMKEAHAAQGKNIYAAAVAAGSDPRALKLLWELLDSSMGRDFNFRTNMLADAR